MPDSQRYIFLTSGFILYPFHFSFTVPLLWSNMRKIDRKSDNFLFISAAYIPTLFLQWNNWKLFFFNHDIFIIFSQKFVPFTWDQKRVKRNLSKELFPLNYIFLIQFKFTLLYWLIYRLIITLMFRLKYLLKILKLKLIINRKIS